MPVVHSGTPKLAIIDRESKRFHQVEPASCREAEPRDVARIRRNFGFNQHNIKHICAKNKKSASRSEALFPSGGNIDCRTSWSNPIAPFRSVRHSHCVRSCQNVQIRQRERRSCSPDLTQHSYRQKLCPALPHDDVSGNDLFAAKFLNAEPFADAVTPVFNAALTFLVSHEKFRFYNWRLVITRSLRS